MYSQFILSSFILGVLLIVACNDHAERVFEENDIGIVNNASKYKCALIAWWKFNEESGELAFDATGNGNTATITNGGWGEGKDGSALQMNGGNDSIVLIPFSESLQTTEQQITLITWAYRTAEHNVDVIGHVYPYLFFGYHGPQFKFQVGNQKGKLASCYADKKYRAELNKWHHLTGTYDGTKARLYVDGNLICSAPLSGLIAMKDEPFTILRYINKNGKIIDEITGRIDDVRIYNRALPEEEIRKIMNSVD